MSEEQELLPTTLRLLHRFSPASLALLFIPALLSAADQKAKLPDAPGKDVFVRVCSGCHGAEIVVGRGLTRDGWTDIVSNMVNRGAQGTEDDFATVVYYLSNNFPPKEDSGGEASEAKKIYVNTATAGDLRSGLDISSKEADALVAYRREKGSFKSIDDLKKVPGLDASKIDAAKDRLVF